MNERSDAQIPVLFVTGRTVPEAWEKAVLAVRDNGAQIKTEYDRPDDPPSLDATVTVEDGAVLRVGRRRFGRLKRI